MLKGKYERIVDQYEKYYPRFSEQTVDWWPSGRLHITVKLRDGTLFEFSSLDCTIRKIQSVDGSMDGDLLRKQIGYNLQKIITTRGLPQREIAEKCGLTDAMLSRYIHGTSMPGVDKLYIIADVLGCRITDILDDQQDS